MPWRPVDQVTTSAYGFDGETDLLAVAMVAYWFRNYWLLRDEFERDARRSLVPALGAK